MVSKVVKEKDFKIELYPNPASNFALLKIEGTYDKVSVMAVGERIINLQRAFACREGITKKDDINTWIVLYMEAALPHKIFIIN